MGCDIHAVVETIDKEDIQTKIESVVSENINRWEGFCSPRIYRNYGLFYALAGVRGATSWPEPLIEPRGVPEDISYLGGDILLSSIPEDYKGETVARCYIFNPDYHTYGFLYLEELEAIYKRYREYFKDWTDQTKPIRPDPEMETIIMMMKTMESFGKKTRLVFAFDN
jgi:hypothetical protein